MKKNVAYVKTNGYDMVVTFNEDTEEARYLTETSDFPDLCGMEDQEQQDAAEAFLETVEDDSSFEAMSYQDFKDMVNYDGCEIVAEIEKEI